MRIQFRRSFRSRTIIPFQTWPVFVCRQWNLIEPNVRPTQMTFYMLRVFQAPANPQHIHIALVATHSGSPIVRPIVSMYLARRPGINRCQFYWRSLEYVWIAPLCWLDWRHQSTVEQNWWAQSMDAVCDWLNRNHTRYHHLHSTEHFQWPKEK